MIHVGNTGDFEVLLSDPLGMMCCMKQGTQLQDAMAAMATAVHAVPLRTARFATPEMRTQLREAAASLVAALDADATPIASGMTFDDLLIGLQRLAVLDLQPAERNRFAEEIAGLHARLRACDDADVQRVLLDATPTGAQLTSLLADTEPSSLDPDAQLSFLSACERQLAWTVARQNHGLLAFAGSNRRDTLYFVDGDQYAIQDARRTEIAAELHWSEAMAHSRLTQARQLRLDLPATARSLTEGRLTPRTATILCEGVQRLTAWVDERIEQGEREHRAPVELAVLRMQRNELLYAYEQRVVAYAERHSITQSRAAVNRALAVLDPAGFAARRARAARASSEVRLDHGLDGMSTLTATLPSEQALTCWRTIDALAQQPTTADPSQAIGLRRVAALFALLTQHSTSGTSAVPVQVDVVIDLDTLLGLNDQPANVHGAGPLPADVARELIAGDPRATIRRIVTDPVTAAPIELGRRYRIDTALRRLIEARDGSCRFPGCGRPAHRCECDHAQAFDSGGTSTTRNLGLACKRHHQCKTHAGWQITNSAEDGSCTWVSPLGRQYHHSPAPVLPALETLEEAGLNIGDSPLCRITRRAFALHHTRTCSSIHGVERCPRVQRFAPTEDDRPPF